MRTSTGLASADALIFARYDDTSSAPAEKEKAWQQYLNSVPGTFSVVGPGDTWTFTGGASHRAEALEATVVIEVFSPVRGDYLRLAEGSDT
jgi:hypothetical protein